VDLEDVPPVEDPVAVTCVRLTVPVARIPAVPEKYAPAAENAMNAGSAAAVKSPSSPDPATAPA